ncbi:MAG: pyridoxamine 5'-phosphate oxidase family protein [Mastigocoleus sp. MO_167.B18]|nr:pyridoxamine 5'-phosphate oxidase family protein [Mastigocoleus sp. MO_167.B18]
MSLAPWRSYLARALQKNRSQPHSRYFQLATVQSDGYPANRTVVFRGFLEDSNQLKIITDVRSEKIIQIHHQARGEICWYFTVTREQFRLAGELTLVDYNHPDSRFQAARHSTWEQISDNARSQFIWANPGEPKSTDTGNLPIGNSDIDKSKPLDNFCLLLLDPVKVDHLQLRGDPQNRCLYILDNSGIWNTTEVNP